MKKKLMSRFLLGIVFIVMSGHSILFGAAINLTWQKNQETDVKGYRLYLGSSSGIYDMVIDTGLETEYTVDWLGTSGNYYFAVSAYTHFFEESKLSEELSYVHGTPEFSIITSPKEGDSFVVGEEIDMICEAIDPDGIVEIKFWLYEGDNRTGTVIHTARTSPGSHTITGLTPGTYRLKGKSRDRTGFKRSSEIITITVNGGTPTPSPTPGPTATQGNTTGVYQAEDLSAVKGCSIGHRKPGYRGTGYVDMGGSGTWFEFHEVAGSGSTTLINIRYAFPTGSRPCSYYINGVKAGTILFQSTGSWGNWESLVIAAELVQGHNTLRFTAGTSGGPNVDEITVSLSVATPTPASSASPTPVATPSPPFTPTAVSGLYKNAGTDLRVACYNVMQSRIFKGNDNTGKSSRYYAWQRMFKAVKADIWALQEMFNAGPSPESFMQEFIEHVRDFSGENEWKYSWDRDGRVLLTPYPVKWEGKVAPRTWGTWLDLPGSVSDRDLLIVNVHLKADEAVDDIRYFIRMVRNGSHSSEMPQDISIIVCGDFDKVYTDPRYQTIAGEGFVDSKPTQKNSGGIDYTFTRIEYLNGNYNIEFGREIDFLLYDSQVFEETAGFVLNSFLVPDSLLDESGLRKADVAIYPERNINYQNSGDDPIKLDHLPIIVDFTSK